MLAQRFSGIFLHGLHERPLVTALWDADIHISATNIGQKCSNLVKIVGRGLDENFAWHNLGGSGRFIAVDIRVLGGIAIELCQELR